MIKLACSRAGAYGLETPGRQNRDTKKKKDKKKTETQNRNGRAIQ